MSHIVRISKKRYYKEKFEQSHNNIKQTWKIIDKVINEKSTKRKLPNAFTYNNDKITDPISIANKFNDYFANVGPNLAKQIPESSSSFVSFLSRTHYESFFIDLVTEEEVEQKLRSLTPSKSSGVDEISPRVARQIAPLIAQPLSEIFNQSF